MDEVVSATNNDPFFALIESSEWNACIGKQAHPHSYIDGYMEAALALVHAVIEQKQYSERWLRFFGQFLGVHKWGLAVCAYAAGGRAGRFSQYTRSGVRPSSARCGLS